VNLKEWAEKNTVQGIEPSQEWSQAPSQASSTCPACGYCPHCGRGGHQFYPNYPLSPYPTWTVGGGSSSFGSDVAFAKAFESEKPSVPSETSPENKD